MNKKTRRSKAIFVFNIFEDLYFPEIFCEVIVFKRQNKVCNLYMFEYRQLYILIIMKKLSRKLSVDR